MAITFNAISLYNARFSSSGLYLHTYSLQRAITLLLPIHIIFVRSHAPLVWTNCNSQKTVHSNASLIITHSLQMCPWFDWVMSVLNAIYHITLHRNIVLGNCRCKNFLFPRLGYSVRVKSILQLLPKFLASPDQQLPWCWLRETDRLLSSMRKKYDL